MHSWHIASALLTLCGLWLAGVHELPWVQMTWARSGSADNQYSKEPRGASRPNIVLILTDDQDLVLDSMQAMPFTSSFIGDAGATFSNFFAHTPVCCPSRGELLSGRYLHNNKPKSADAKSCMRFNADDAFHRTTFATDLKKAGYATLMSGKYLNGLSHSKCPEPGNATVVAPPPGWDRYFVMCPDRCYTDCFFGDNGMGRTYNDKNYEKGSNYAPSVIGNVTMDFIKTALDDGNPFFAYVAPHSPHSPAIPAPWYADAFPGAGAKRTRAYNVSAPDHHWAVRSQPYIDSSEEEIMDDLARKRLQTLLSVDDIVREVSELLRSRGALENTYFLFTSDHGFHMGQFCLGPCKRQPYDTDIRIPLLVRGPGIQEGQQLQHLAGIPDLAPTILDIGGLLESSSLPFDGRSLLPLLRKSDSNNQIRMLTSGYRQVHSSQAWRSAYLIEYIATEELPKIAQGHVKDNGNNTFRGLRVLTASEDLAYFEFTDVSSDWDFAAPDFYELYNLSSDPDQLHNIYSQAAPELKGWLAKYLKNEYSCQASSCA